MDSAVQTAGPNAALYFIQYDISKYFMLDSSGSFWLRLYRPENGN